MLTEYLFVDEARLDTYASQLNPAGTVVEKTKELTAGLSWTGPKAEMKQSERVRLMTRHEKAELILNQLRAESNLLEGRPDLPDTIVSLLEFEELRLKHFVFERCEASKVIVPANAVDGYDTPSFVFWLSPSGTRVHPQSMLCLLEDFRLGDRKAELVQITSYSLLETLVEYGKQKLLHDDRLENKPPDPLVRPDGAFDPRAGESNGHERILEEYLAEYIDRWRCIVSRPRKIETLYRIREIGGDIRMRNGIFAYPIWITAG